MTKQVGRQIAEMYQLAELDQEHLSLFTTTRFTTTNACFPCKRFAEFLFCFHLGGVCELEGVPLPGLIVPERIGGAAKKGRPKRKQSEFQSDRVWRLTKQQGRTKKGRRPTYEEDQIDSDDSVGIDEMFEERRKEDLVNSVMRLLKREYNLVPKKGRKTACKSKKKQDPYNSASRRKRVSNTADGDKYTKGYWMEVSDVVFVLSAVLGTSDVGEPTTWKVFIQTVKRVLRKNTKGGKTIAFTRGYLNQVINTDAEGTGLHWLQASADFVERKVRVLEPFGPKDIRKRISQHVESEYRKQMRGLGMGELSFMHSGAQAPGSGSDCGQISSWYQLSSRVALEQGMDVSEWMPEKPPKFWTDVVSELLRIRDDHAELNLTALDFQTIGLRPIFEKVLNGKGAMYNMLKACRKYRAALKEMGGVSGETKVEANAKAPTVRQPFVRVLRCMDARPQQCISFDVREIFPEWFSTEGNPLRTASVVSDSDSTLDPLIVDGSPQRPAAKRRRNRSSRKAAKMARFAAELRPP